MDPFPNRGKIPRFFPSHFFRDGSVELASSLPGENPSIFPLSLFRDGSVELAPSLTGEKSLDFSPLTFSGTAVWNGPLP